jgi:hypothetical protein
MINYGRILKQRERDNPSTMCRASYLVSNVGDSIKCYGRSLRFPQDKNLYYAEMKLALGDVIMQCRLIEEENGYEHNKIDNTKRDSMSGCITMMMYYATHIVDHMQRRPNEIILFDVGDERTARETVIKMMDTIGEICNWMDWNIEEIEHLGFLHTIERFEIFERDDWK